jgi:biopolymer transport protein ExbB
VRANRVTLAKFDEFAHDLHDFFATGSRVEAGAAATLTNQRSGAPVPPITRK